MEISLQVIPAGDTTTQEISKASQDLRDALEGLHGVEIPRAPPPEGAMGVAEVIGNFVVSLALPH